MVDEKKVVKLNSSKISLPKSLSTVTKEKSSTAMPDTDLIERERTSAPQVRPKKLKLVEKGFKPTKTRSELYNELAKEEEIYDKDVTEYPSPIVRLIALVLDLIFNGVIIYLGFNLFPIFNMIIQLFMDKYKLVFMFGAEYLNMVTLGFTEITLVMLFIIIPGAFFNTSFGKKIMGLKVRGTGQFTISIGQHFQREVIFKPLSIALIIGFILPFFDEQKRSLHDRLAKTFVIKK